MKCRTSVLAALIVMTTACAHTQGAAAGDAELHAQRKAELEAFREEMVRELRTLREEVVALRTATEQAREKQRDLLAKLEERPAPTPARPSRPRGPDPAAVYSVPVDGAPMMGPQDAWVTIVEFSDFQCPYCKRAAPTMSQLRDKYGDDLRVVYRHNPLAFHDRAMAAAVASMCAHEQRMFWPMHDVIFENQRALADEQIASYARKLGNLSFKKWKKCYEAERPKQSIIDDQKNAMALGARGTPAFFINGRFLSGAQPAQNFERIIDEELAKAKNSGIPRASYYTDAVVAKGKTSL